MIGIVDRMDYDGDRVLRVALRFTQRGGDDGVLTREITACERIGQGSFGTVYRALCDDYPRLAMKISTGKSSRLRQELEVLSKVCTKGKLLLPRFEFGALNKAGDLMVVCMELCVPSTLHDLLLSTRLCNEADMLFLGYQVIQAVSYVHEAGCIHRDIKLQNFVFDLDGNLKLIDFGLACSSLRPPPGDVVAGTVSFMSPEMAHNALHKESRVSVGVAADIWSIGIVLFSIFTQRNPYPPAPSDADPTGSDGDGKRSASPSGARGDNERLLRRVALGEWQWPVGCAVAAELRELVSALLVKDPEQRPTIGALLGKKLWNLRRRVPPACVTAFLGLHEDDFFSPDEAPLMRAVEQRSAGVAAFLLSSRPHTPERSLTEGDAVPADTPPRRPDGSLRMVAKEEAVDGVTSLQVYDVRASVRKRSRPIREISVVMAEETAKQERPARSRSRRLGTVAEDTRAASRRPFRSTSVRDRRETISPGPPPTTSPAGVSGAPIPVPRDPLAVAGCPTEVEVSAANDVFYGEGGLPTGGSLCLVEEPIGPLAETTPAASSCAGALRSPAGPSAEATLEQAPALTTHRGSEPPGSRKLNTSRYRTASPVAEADADAEASTTGFLPDVPVPPPAAKANAVPRTHRVAPERGGRAKAAAGRGRGRNTTTTMMEALEDPPFRLPEETPAASAWVEEWVDLSATEAAERIAREGVLALEHAWLLASFRLTIEEDQERYNITWLADEQVKSAAHPHRFKEMTRVASRRYQYGFVCDGCDYDFLPEDTGRGGRALHYFHCPCGRDLCPECYAVYQRRCTCDCCQVVHLNCIALRDHLVGRRGRGAVASRTAAPRGGTGGRVSAPAVSPIAPAASRLSVAAMRQSAGPEALHGGDGGRFERPLHVVPEGPWRPFAAMQRPKEVVDAMRPTPEEREALLNGEWVRHFFLHPTEAGDAEGPYAFVYHAQPGRTGAIFLTNAFALHSAVFSVLERQFFVVEHVDTAGGDDVTRVTNLLKARSHPDLRAAFLALQEIAAYDTNMMKQRRAPGTVSVYQAPRSAYTCNGDPFLYIRWFRFNEDRSLSAFLLSNGAVQVFVQNEYELRWFEESRKFLVRCNGECEMVDDRTFALAPAINHLLYDAFDG